MRGWPKRLLGRELPKVNMARDFLDRFHDEDLALLRPPREEQESLILPPSKPEVVPQNIGVGSVWAITGVMDTEGVGENQTRACRRVQKWDRVGNIIT